MISFLFSERELTFTFAICYHISSSVVKAKLLKLKMNKGTWCRFSMLVELSDEISDTVADLFNKSLISGEAGNWQMLHPYLKKRKEIKCVQL